MHSNMDISVTTYVIELKYCVRVLNILPNVFSLNIGRYYVTKVLIKSLVNILPDYHFKELSMSLPRTNITHILTLTCHHVKYISFLKINISIIKSPYIHPSPLFYPQ